MAGSTLLQEQYPLQYGAHNPYLRTTSQSIDTINEEVEQLGADLIELMREYDGVWLAAPQIGKDLRMIATTQRKGTGKKQKHITDTLMINPDIIEESDETITTEEGCLSLPWVIKKVERPKTILLRYQWLDGKTYTQTYTGFNAVIIQHEIDHLDGILFIDKAIH